MASGVIFFYFRKASIPGRVSVINLCVSQQKGERVCAYKICAQMYAPDVTVFPPYTRELGCRTETHEWGHCPLGRTHGADGYVVVEEYGVV